ncbi:MAG: hypothetical protein ACYCU8_04840 [Ferrimicrobium acidiphilum]
MGKTGQRIQGGVALLVLAGAGGAWYVYNHDPALKRQLSQAVNVAKPVPKPPANAPVGFNATRTAFVLPHKLGYLPAPELALAKSDAAYAKGLANLGDWSTADVDGPGHPPFWMYVGSSSGAAGVKGNAIGSIGELTDFFNGYQTTSNVHIHDFHKHQLWMPKDVITIYGQNLVAPSFVEIQAAPVQPGNTPPFCVPSPLALLHNGHVDVTPQLPMFTAGPSTIFTYSPTTFVDAQGAASCNGFS